MFSRLTRAAATVTALAAIGVLTDTPPALPRGDCEGFTEYICPSYCGTHSEQNHECVMACGYGWGAVFCDVVPGECGGDWALECARGAS